MPDPGRWFLRGRIEAAASLAVVVETVKCGYQRSPGKWNGAFKQNVRMKVIQSLVLMFLSGRAAALMAKMGPMLPSDWIACGVAGVMKKGAVVEGI